jgi:hypothetical protein
LLAWLFVGQTGIVAQAAADKTSLKARVDELAAKNTSLKLKAEGLSAEVTQLKTDQAKA